MDEALIGPTVIRNLDLSAVRERLVHKKGWTVAHADRLIEEYREYLALFVVPVGMVAMAAIERAARADCGPRVPGRSARTVC